METKIYRPVDSEQQIRRLHLYIKKWNKEHKASRQQIKAQHMQTAEMLVKIALQQDIQFNKATHLMDLVYADGVAKAGTFNANGAAIAKRLNLHRKSLDNHLKRLKEAGIAASFSDPANGRMIRAGGKHNETLFAINKAFFID